MKKPVYRVMQNPYNEVGTSRTTEAKCRNNPCINCGGSGVVVIGFGFALPVLGVCYKCKGKRFNRTFVGGRKMIEDKCTCCNGEGSHPSWIDENGKIIVDPQDGQIATFTRLECFVCEGTGKSEK